ncbi:MAG: hypothetical protein J0L92_33380 [Deltaproteobacteria bacterium]|nr:hypothetical protein [Deltaproteobacteria bacterium]
MSARRTARLAWVLVATSLVGCPSVTTASCAAGAAVEYRWLYAYTGEATPTEWTEWRRSSEALVVRPIPPYGVRMWMQARCVRPASVSEPSETATACRLATSEPC